MEIDANGPAALNATCLVCRHDVVRHGEVVVAADSDRTRMVGQCTRCGFIELAAAEDVPSNSKRAKRHGSEAAAGRDYSMASLGAAVLGRGGLKVLLWEPGVTGDIERIEALDSVASVTCAAPSGAVHPAGDVRRIDTTLATTRYFDLTVANEVAQSLVDPNEGLASMLRSIGSNGLVILSTDLYDGSDLSKLAFPKNPAHRWFWTGQALAAVAEREGHHVDVRIPQIAVKKKFWRKRYVIMSHDVAVMRQARVYFGSVLHAPSEAS